MISKIWSGVGLLPNLRNHMRYSVPFGALMKTKLPFLTSHDVRRVMDSPQRLRTLCHRLTYRDY